MSLSPSSDATIFYDNLVGCDIVTRTILEARVRINQNGRVVIPVEFREALGILPGDEIELRLDDDELRISRPDVPDEEVERVSQAVAGCPRNALFIAE